MASMILEFMREIVGPALRELFRVGGHGKRFRNLP
jgi:hypothetical protein